jgi:ABC-2 type transport system permease protein
VSSAFVPPESMPSVLQNIATYNPITPLSDTVRGLLLGQPVGSSWPAAVLWCVGIFLVGRVAAGLLFRRSR